MNFRLHGQHVGGEDNSEGTFVVSGLQTLLPDSVTQRSQHKVLRINLNVILNLLSS